MTGRPLSAVAIIGVGALAAPAFADPDEKRPLIPDPAPASAPATTSTLTGNWGGLRSRLGDRGVEFDASYIADTRVNLRGGLHTGAVYHGLATWGMNLDLNKLTGGSGLQLRASAILPHGESPTAERVGDVLGVSNVDAFRHEPALYETWIGRSFAGDALDVRLGWLLADTEFAQTDRGALFTHSSFGWPGFISLNTHHTGPAYFRPAAGVRIRYQPSDDWQIQGGVYEGDTFDGSPAHDDPHRFRFGARDGVFSLTEVAHLWRDDRDSETGSLGGRAGVGGWFHSGTSGDPLDAEPHAHTTGGAYLFLEQTFWRAPASPNARPSALGAFLRFGASPGNHSVSPWAGDAGLVFEGLLPERYEDALGLGVAWGWLGDGFRASAASDPVTFRQAEVAIELTWLVSLTRWCRVQPTCQWITFPGGSHDLEAALVVGARSEITF